MDTVVIYTDGSCSGNPGPGGWGAILMDRHGNKKELHGSLPTTTNNMAELIAIKQGLAALTRPCNVTIHTDSRNAIGWLRDNWKRKSPKIIKTTCEIEELIQNKHHQVSYFHVAGHSGDEFNERANILAQRGTEEARLL